MSEDEKKVDELMSEDEQKVDVSMSEDEKKVDAPKSENEAIEKVKDFFVKNWRMITAVGVSVVCTATLSVGLALGLSKGNNPDDDSSAPEYTKGLGVFYYDTGLEEYQISLGDNGKVTFIIGGETKSGTYTSIGDSLRIKFDGETEAVTAKINGDVLELNYDGGQFRFFKKVYYVVSYDEMGGTEVVDEKVVNGQTFECPADPTRMGYEFVGWYMDSDYTTPFMFGTQIVTGNITLYAHWALVDLSIAAYEVDFDLG